MSKRNDRDLEEFQVKNEREKKILDCRSMGNFEANRKNFGNVKGRLLRKNQRFEMISVTDFVLIDAKRIVHRIETDRLALIAKHH